MFKLVVLCALLSVALANPSLYKSPVYSSPAYTAFAVQEPAYAHVGSIVKSVPSAVSHQSSAVVHSSAHVVANVLAPSVKSTYYTTKSLVAPAAYVKTIAAPLVYKSYVNAAPVWYKSW